MTDKHAFYVETPNHEDGSTINNTITSAFQLIDTSIEHGSNNMKAMDSSLNLVLSLMEEVVLKEKSAKEAKEEAAVSGLDILAKVEAVKQEQQHVKETNDMHAREVYAQKVILAKNLKELQLRLSGVLHEGDEYVRHIDEMCKVLKTRVTTAITAKELADKEKLEKEALALEALAFEESQMLKLVEESERLKQEAVKNFKLLNLYKEREFSFNILHGDVSDKYPDIISLRERIDQPVPQICGFKSSRQTPTCFTSSSSSVTGFLTPFLEPPKETADEHAKIDLPQTEPLSNIPDLDSEKQEGNNGPSDFKSAPVLVAYITEVGHSISTEGFIASDQTNAVPVAAPLTQEHNVRRRKPQRGHKKKKKLRRRRRPWKRNKDNLCEI